MAVALAHRPLRSRAGPTLLCQWRVWHLHDFFWRLDQPGAIARLLIFLGAADMISVIIRATLVQLRTPMKCRRVMAVDMVSSAHRMNWAVRIWTDGQWFGAVPAVILEELARWW